MGDFDPVPWETIEAATGPPAADVVEHVERLRADVDGDDPYVAVKTIYDAWKRDRDEDGSLPEQGAAFVVAYLLERDGVVDLDEGPFPSLADRRPSDERLRELFWERRQTMWWIAIRVGVHWALVQYWLYEADVPLQERNFTAESMARIRAHREGG